ncbi:Sieve element occlusion [Trema orientale]|uniref:Sieve element occlusion n=1 Tax=Trema orientale TaxID=63057 RepID=A0A2P5DMY8_TREOI|nr:Sieve element occlusion [Trema orientale]
MAGIVAPSQKIVGLPRQEQSFATRVLGEGGGRAARLLGDSRSSTRAHGASDESELGRKILATHEADERGIYVKPVLNIIDVIFYRAAADIPGYTQGLLSQSDIDEKALHSATSLHDMVELPTRIISAISCEIFSKCSSGVDVNTIVMDILQLIKHYNWDSKVVLVLVAFAITFGEFRLVVQLFQTNPLAKAVALLKQLPDILEHVGALRPKLEALFELIGEILDVTRKIVEFYELPRSEYFTRDSPEIIAAASHIPTAVYWTIRSIVVSATQVLALTGMGIEYLTEQWELSSLANKLNNIKGHLVELIRRCHEYIQKVRDNEAFEALGRILLTTHIDNTKPLAALFHYNDGQPALYDCYNKRRIGTEDLRRKIVALFITDLDPDVARGSEYAILQQMYLEKRHNLTRAESQYEVVWVPITDYWGDEKHRLFETLREQMEWHSIHHPTVVSPVVIRYIKEKWNFSKKPMLVVIDTQGKIVHLNAIHMMCIWGSLAYPFTTNREKLLWEEMRWSIELLADNLEPNMNVWLQEDRHICLYGGEDIDWIRKFTRIAKDVAREAGITLELLYVGRSKPKERAVKTIIELIQKEGLSRTLDWNLIWYFWMRLESMWHSKGQLTKPENVKNDPIMQGIIAMLSYGSSEQGWAVISKGIGEMVKSNGEHMFKVLSEHGLWKPREIEIGFVPALGEYLKRVNLEAPHHCTNLILPATGAMPETVACSECGRLMERYTMFRCCLD